MANLRDLRRRIKSIAGTAQITRAMQMVAAAKMRKAQNATLMPLPAFAISPIRCWKCAKFANAR